ncbi:hypothetical protein AG4045_017755 [Apium graveolens]|uniref:TF-B3 domain-containing protein n=1 Tax=Apium graveolens TaxID=4045 RepID=A0A6L5BA12_APIGR|nr:hypothetical protein AG4045_017755 [Apium graveolens]
MPSSLAQRSGINIPSFGFKNGEIYTGTYTRSDERLGRLMPLIRKNYIQPYDKHIPKEIHLFHHVFKASDEITLVRNAKSWKVGIVLSNGMPRVSAGWNKFSSDNKLKVADRLIFYFLDNVDDAVFNVEV